MKAPSSHIDRDTSCQNWDLFCDFPRSFQVNTGIAGLYRLRQVSSFYMLSNSASSSNPVIYIYCLKYRQPHKINHRNNIRYICSTVFMEGMVMQMDTVVSDRRHFQCIFVDVYKCFRGLCCRQLQCRLRR
jgi:hypothetical protein